MQIPDEIRKCVLFLAYKTEKHTNIIGTAFLVNCRVGRNGHVSKFVVTCRHVIEEIQKRLTVDNKVYLRVNFKSGKADYAETDLSDWQFHETDKAADIAICRIDHVLEMDHLAYRLEDFLTEEIISRERIGIGDDVFLTGLFSSRPGIERNIPILRVGNIAAMPDEKVETSIGLMDAYLVEARSIGGLSGSPVFVHYGTTRILDGKTVLGGGAAFHMLGMMQGHWESGQGLTDGALEDSTGQFLKKLNMGIAIVIPCSTIAEVLQVALDDLKLRNEVLLQQYHQDQEFAFVDYSNAGKLVIDLPGDTPMSSQTTVEPPSDAKDTNRPQPDQDNG